MTSSLALPLTVALALPLAWAGDQLFGEPRNALHPVAWIGRVLAPVGESLVRRSPVVAFAGGAVAWIALAAGVGWIAATWQNIAAAWPWWLALPAMALALKPTFAWRMLRDEVEAVDAAFDLLSFPKLTTRNPVRAEPVEALRVSRCGTSTSSVRTGLGLSRNTKTSVGIVDARSRLARLVSRDVSAFDERLVRETAIETLAENLNDSVVAPLFWFVLLGLPGAAIYRFANTADAMWGYRGRYEWAGKWAAHADDVLSWWPARLTAWMLRPTVSARTLRVCRDEARRTPSPNGGWPMSAIALRLSVRLRKPGVYALNAAAPSPGRGQVTLALRLAGRCAWQSAVAATLLCGWRAW